MAGLLPKLGDTLGVSSNVPPGYASTIIINTTILGTSYDDTVISAAEEHFHTFKDVDALAIFVTDAIRSPSHNLHHLNNYQYLSNTYTITIRHTTTAVTDVNSSVGSSFSRAITATSDTHLHPRSITLTGTFFHPPSARVDTIVGSHTDTNADAAAQ
ncbi:hypothetical protein CkaCkLH20_03806 [Colletotrichum karsti]|uniref:Uncharacterized protein n=1 Tax=Colletotrichum karsti TaxID=1095194 RepID=A0A9P6IBR9_9PEZI|nr:uncharacterized protein CkaCkLH20_03806 [Colletotrichum karsti]KAF9878906.1 hypothetical protein CkaCkLH20_03806 [Colletotrichum karsti]